MPSRIAATLPRTSASLAALSLPLLAARSKLAWSAFSLFWICCSAASDTLPRSCDWNELSRDCRFLTERSVR